MKTKHKNKFTRPRMYYQAAAGKGYYPTESDRIRIFYPDGRVEWASLCLYPIPIDSNVVGVDIYLFDYDPCWQNFDRRASMLASLRQAGAYDKSQGFPKQIFIGEL